MGKRKERSNDFDYEDDVAQALFGDIDLDDEDFFEQFQPKRSRAKSRRSRDARRRIEEYREEKELARRLHEFYDDEQFIE